MIKKKVIALTLVSAVGISNSSLFKVKANADENNVDDLKTEETDVENKELNLTEEEKDKLDITEEALDSVENTIKPKEIIEINSIVQKSSSTGRVVNVSSSLRIRESASTTSNVKGTLKNGENFNIESKEGTWYKINYKGINGYVHSDYVSVINGSINGNNSSNNTASDNNIETTKFNGEVVNVSSSLRIRANANTSASIVGYLKPKEKVNIISEHNGWYKIQKGSITGHVSSNYIKKLTNNAIEKPNDNNSNIEKPEVIPDTKPDNNEGLTLFKTAKVGKLFNVSTNLRVRSNPSTTATVIAYLLPNSTFTVEGENGSWYYVNISGKKGYAHKDYVKATESSSSSGSNSSSNENSSINSNYTKVLNIMKSQFGSPYVFGGAGETITTSLLNNLKGKYPNMNYNMDSKYINTSYKAFDCSGLMQWSFKQIGVNIGRSTYNQINNGIEVNLNSLKEGDLLFYSDLNHVGMYIGDGKWIESPRSGEFVRIASVPWNKIGRARRVL